MALGFFRLTGARPGQILPHYVTRWLSDSSVSLHVIAARSFRITALRRCQILPHHFTSFRSDSSASLHFVCVRFSRITSPHCCHILLHHLTWSLSDSSASPHLVVNEAMKAGAGLPWDFKDQIQYFIQILTFIIHHNIKCNGETDELSSMVDPALCQISTNHNKSL
jgi:hypothetical protein